MKRFMLLQKGIPVIFVSTLVLGTFFQNCSPVAFTSLSSEDGTSQSCEKNPHYAPILEKVRLVLLMATPITKGIL